MNIVLNYLAISALTTAAATAVAMGEPASLELAIARVGIMLGGQKEDLTNSLTSVKVVDVARMTALHDRHGVVSVNRY